MIIIKTTNRQISGIFIRIIKNLDISKDFLICDHEFTIHNLSYVFRTILGLTKKELQRSEELIDRYSSTADSSRVISVY